MAARYTDDHHDQTSLDSNMNLVSHELPENPLYIHDEVHYSKFKQRVFRITSCINSFVFLSILMTLAICRSLVVSTTHYFQNLGFQQLEGLPQQQQQQEAALPKKDRLLVPHLSYYVELLNLKLFEYKVTTKDNFIINLQRIVNPDEAPELRDKRKPVLLLHGLLQSSGAYISSGQDSLAFYLHKQGYDVWLGNNRCGFNPQHVFYDPKDPNMWNWNIYNMAMYDLPAMIDQVLSQSAGFDKVALVAHSQGTTQTFLALLSKNIAVFNNGLNQKLSCFIALAPAVFGGELLRTKLFIKFMNFLPKKQFHYFFGVLSFMPIMMSMRNVLVLHKIFGFLSYSMFSFLFNWNDKLWDSRYRTRHFIFSPVYISCNLMTWWLSNDGFYANAKTIFNYNDQWFDEQTPPIYLFVPGRDNLVNCDLLLDHFAKYEPHVRRFEYKILPTYSHLDVLWAKDVLSTIGAPIVDFLRSLD